MEPHWPARLHRIDLQQGVPSHACLIASGSLHDMVCCAVEAADDDLWRFTIEIVGGGALLPSDVAKLYACWGGPAGTDLDAPAVKRVVP